MEFIQGKRKEINKVLFTGLDAAGKTSIILTLQREFSKIAVVEPTRGAQRRIFKLLGREITEWDLGGQKQYRISYLKNPGKYFDNTETAIYVIDIQNTLRIPEAISYLNDVIEQFKKLELDPSINVFFHKCDPVLIKNSQEEIAKLINDLIKKINNIVNYKKIRFFITSIFDPSNIMRAMSEIMLEMYPKSQLIQKTVKEFAKKLKCEGLVIIDDSSLLIGSYYKNEEIEHMLSRAVSHFLTFNDNFQINGLVRSDDQMLVQRYGKYFLFKQITLKDSVLPYYVLVLTDDNPFDLYFIKREYGTFIRVLKDMLDS